MDADLHLFIEVVVDCLKLPQISPKLLTTRFRNYDGLTQAVWSHDCILGFWQLAHPLWPFAVSLSHATTVHNSFAVFPAFTSSSQQNYRRK